MRPLDDFDGPDRVLCDEPNPIPSADEWPVWAPLFVLLAFASGALFMWAWLN